MIIPSKDLTLDDVPRAGASDLEIIQFAQTLNGYGQVGGQASELGEYVDKLNQQPLTALSLDDLRILLFALQRAHYYQGGGWGEDDPILEQMRRVTRVIRLRMEARSADVDQPAA